MDRFRGLRVVIYSNDHHPEHVHVIGADKEAVFELNCPAGPVVLRENYHFSRNEIGAIKKELSQRLRLLCRRWRQIHGER